ncbi:MAG: hypothetical protein U0802_09565 [Candidatus Binatia bacterium]
MLKLMSRVQDLGWHDAQKMKIGTANPKKRIIRKDDDIHLLKGTPLRWRLYLYVRQSDKHIVYVHAVSKNRDEEDPGSYRTARQRYDRRTNGQLVEIKFPD